MPRHTPPPAADSEARLAQRLKALEEQVSRLEQKNQTAASFYRLGAQNLAPGWTKIKLNTIALGNTTLCDTVNGWYLVPAGGDYLVSGSVAAISGTTGIRFIASVFINGGGEAIRGDATVITAVKPYTSALAGIVACSTGDRLELWGYQDAPGEISIEESGAQNRLSVCRVY